MVCIQFVFIFYHQYADNKKLNYNEGVFCRQKIENSGALLLSIRDITKLYYNKFLLHRHYKIVS